MSSSRSPRTTITGVVNRRPQVEHKGKTPAAFCLKIEGLLVDHYAVAMSPKGRFRGT